jgi:hypothetical protein
MMVEGEGASGFASWAVAIGTASSPTGPFTAFSAILSSLNLVENTFGTASGPNLHKINGQWILWYHQFDNGGNSGFPSVETFAQSADMVNWIKYPFVPIIDIAQTNFATEQMGANPFVFEYNGTSYNWYDGDNNAGSSAAIGVATYAGTLAQVIVDSPNVSIESQSFTVSPSTVPANHASNFVSTLTGVGESWTPGTPGTPTFAITNSVSGTTTFTKTAQTISGVNAATVTGHTGAGTGTYTIGDGSTTTAVTVGTGSFTISPTTGAAGASQSLTLTGTNKIWTLDTAAGLFTVSGGSIGTPSFSTDNAGTVTLTNLAIGGSITITDTSDGTTQTFTVAPAAPTGLVANGTVGEIDLSWTATVGAVTYNVYRGNSTGAESGTPIATGLTSPSYADTGLGAGLTRFYTVKAINPGGTSPASAEATATTTAERLSASGSLAPGDTNKTVTLAILYAIWTAGTPGTPTIGVSKAPTNDVVKNSQVVTGVHGASLNLDAGATVGIITFTDPISGKTATLQVSTSSVQLSAGVFRKKTNKQLGNGISQGGLGTSISLSNGAFHQKT